MAVPHNGLCLVKSLPAPHVHVTPPCPCKSTNVPLSVQRIQRTKHVRAAASPQSVVDAVADAVVASATSVSVDGAVTELPWQIVVGAIGEQAFVFVPWTIDCAHAKSRVMFVLSSATAD